MKKISRGDLQVLLISFVLGAICSGIISITILSKKMPEIVRIEVRKDSIPDNDKRIIRNILPILKEREDFSPVKYKGRGGTFDGFGHLCLNNEHIPDTITIDYADSLLRSDVMKSYYENERIKRITLKKDIYNIFISGHK